MTFVPPALLAIMNSQRGLATRPQALDHHVDPRVLMRTGAWLPVHRGVYADRAVWEAASPYRGQPQMRTLAAVLRMRRGWVVSHDSACFELDLPVVDARRSDVHVTRPGYGNAWIKARVHHHLAPYLESQVTRTDGLQVLDVARTFADMAREHGFEAGVVAGDAALAGGVPRSALAAAYEPMGNWPGVRTVRAAVDFLDPGAETSLESLARILVAELGLGSVETQFPVATRRGVVWCDLRIGNHVFEADGKQKYLDVRSGGLRTVDPDEHLWDEKVRERLLRDEGLGVSRIFYLDHWGGRRRQALARLRSDVLDTIRLRGSDLSPRLADQAARIRRDQPRVRRLTA